MIATIDSSGVITRTYFDGDDRPQFVVQNLQGQGIEVAPPPNDCGATAPDENVCTEYAYDDEGNQIAVIDPNGRLTRTYFDTLNRPWLVVENWVGGNFRTDPPPAYDPGFPDRNVRTGTRFDDVGNAIATIDTLGRITRTYYDGNSRPVAVVQNLAGWSIDNVNPPPRGTGGADENLRTDMAYDAAGNTIATTDPNGVITRTYYDPLNRPQYVVTNLVGQGIGVETPPNDCNATAPDENVCTEYRYDDAGSQIAVIDPNGVITRTYYDPASRPQYVVLNLVGQGIEAPNPPNGCVATAPAENVCTEYVYDDGGSQIGVYDPNRVITRTYYDGLGRVRYVAQNLTGQGIENETPPTFNPANPDQNVRTDTVYGPAGEVLRTIDTLSHATVMCYDGQGRVVRTVQNPSVSDPCGSYTPSTETDEAITTHSKYDGVGSRLSVTDPNGLVTTFGYDGVYRLPLLNKPPRQPERERG